MLKLNLKERLRGALGFDEAIQAAVDLARTEGVTQGRAEISQQIAPLMYDMVTQKKHSVYAIDNPYAYTVPQSPRKRPMAAVDTFTLRQIAETYDIVRAIIEHLKREVYSIPWEIIPKDTNDDSDATKRRCQEAMEWFDTPGGLGGFGWTRQSYEFAMIEDLLVIGAQATYVRENQLGTLFEAKGIDAATIRPRIDQFGWSDEKYPFEQWIMGVVIAKFRADQLLYSGINARTWNPYYASPLEWLLAPIISGMKADEWNREWLTSGNAPGDDVFTLPETLTPDQVKTYISIFEEVMAGNTKERRKVRFLPSGSDRLSAGNRKDQEFQAFELWLLKRCCSMFGVQPASIGYSGEQYKVSQENSMEQTSQFGAGVILEFRTTHYNHFLDRNGYGDLEVQNIKNTYENPRERAERLKMLVEADIYTSNDAREVEGKDPIEGGEVLASEKAHQKALEVAAAKPKLDNKAKEGTGRATSRSALLQWQSKALNRVKNGSSALCRFVTNEIDDVTKAGIYIGLDRDNLTPDDIKEVFRPHLTEEPE